ncbi:MAG: hypothetical protein AB1726_02480, partial [Planctomycetota bacterium]
MPEPPLPPDPPPRPARPGAERRRRSWWLGVALLAVLPSLGTLSAPLVAEDAGILGHVHRHGAWEDWVGPQYGLHLLAFWRPVVSASWWLQEAISGVDPLPLRAVNLLCHALAAVVVGLVARRAGAGALGALAAGGLAAVFPEQGGTVTWAAGRTDGIVSLGMALACLAVLARRPAAAFAAAFLACATKEFAFALPVWAAALLLAKGSPRIERRRDLWRGLAPLCAAVGIALVSRRLALGAWGGGYLAGASRGGLL